MFTKNWYAILANYAVGTDGMPSIFKCVNTSGSEVTLSTYGSTNAWATFVLYNILSKPQIASMNSIGVYFGTGNTAPTPDDYCFSGNALSSGLTASFAISGSSDSDGNAVTAVYTLVNNSSNDVTIGEIAMLAYNNNNYFIIERTALEAPITIPANGVGQVTYTIRIPYPTA